MALNDYLLYGESVEESFVSTRQDYMTVQEVPIEDFGTKPFLIVYIEMDDEVKTIERTLMTVIDALGNTGGFMSIIYVAALTLVQ